MQRRLVKKLHSNRGASIIIAMAGFLVAAIVSLVIVQAALTNAARLRKERQNEQAYLIAESVAYLLRDEIIADGFEDEGGQMRTKRFIDMDVISSSGIDTVIGDYPTDGISVMNSQIADVLKELCVARKEQILSLPDDSYGVAKVTASSVIPVSSTGGSGEISGFTDQVNGTEVSFLMPAVDNDKIESKSATLYYDVVALIQVPLDVSDASTGYYTTRLNFTASVSNNGDSTCVYWTSASQTRRGDSE